MKWGRIAVSAVLGVRRPPKVDETESSHRFELELNYATSRLAAGLRDRDSYIVTSGLEIFASLAFFAIAYQGRQANGATDPRQSGGPGVYGDEWRILLSELSTIQAAATNCQDSRLRSKVLDFFLGVGTRLMADAHYPAARDVTSSLGWMWDDIVARRGHWTAADEDYFLMRLRETANYIIPTRPDALTLRVHAEAFCGLFARCVRLAQAHGQIDSTRAAVETLVEARAHAQANDYQNAFQRAKGATLLTLLGWVLLTLPQEDSEAQVGLAGTLLSHLDNRNAWSTMEDALDEDFKYALSVSWWEMEGKSIRGVSGGVLEIGSYIRIAALILGARRGTMFVPDYPVESVGDIAWSLSNSLKDLTESRMPKLAPLLPAERERGKIDAELQRAVEKRDERRSAELEVADLDHILVGEFHAAVGEAYARSESVLDLLDVSTCFDLDEPPRFGFNRLEHKWWFVRAQDSSEPRQLAETFVRGIRRGEDQAVMLAIREAVEPTPASIDELEKKLRDWLAVHITSGNALVMTNSWMAAEALAGARYEALADGAPLSFETLGTSIPLYRVSDTQPPYVSIVSSPDGVEAVIGRLEEPENGGVLHNNLLVSVVRPLAPEEITRWASEATPEKELRMRLVVKVLEALTVTVVDAGKVALWVLPEDTY